MRLQVKDLKRYGQLIAQLAGWSSVGVFKTAVTRHLADSKRKRAEEDEAERAMERLAIAAEEGFARIAEGRPVDIAREFIAHHMPNLVHVGGEWLDHDVNAYRPSEQTVVRSRVQAWMDNAVNNETGQRVLVNKKSLDDVMDALRGLVVRDAGELDTPAWLVPQAGDSDPKLTIACRNGLLDVMSGDLVANTPRFLTRNGLTYDYEDPFLVLEPSVWFGFLESIWPDAEGGAESKRLLQEWMGYMLTSDTRHQKILLLLGPGRSGKGTIIRTMTELIGAANVADTSLNKLGGEFGMQSLIGKQMMVVSDMRLGAHANAGRIAETLLNISGEDRVNIGRKFLPDWVGRLKTRLVLAGNFKLVLPDQSGALAMRYLPLVLTKSFEGREDLDLGKKLEPELPFILHWALDGLRRLTERGHFVQTESGKRALDRIRKQASPIRTFIKERCVLGPEATVEKTALFESFSEWAADSDVRDTYVESTFARDLYEAGDSHIDSSRLRGGSGRLQVYTGIALKPEHDYQGY